MAWTKLKTSIVVGTVILLAVAGTTVLTLKAMAHYREKAREEAVWASVAHVVDVVTRSQQLSPADMQQVESVSNIISIRPTQFAGQINDGFLQNSPGYVLLGIAMPMSGLFGHAYGISRTRIANPQALPSGKYDFVGTRPDHRLEELQAGLKKQFGLIAIKVMRQTNLLLLTVARTNSPGLRPNGERGGKAERYFAVGTPDNGHIKYHNRDMEGIVKILEHHLGISVVDQTRAGGLHQFVLDDDETDLQTINQALLDQLGLQLTPDTQMIEMIQVQKVK